MSLQTDLENAYPWIKQLGLSASWFQDVAATAQSSQEVASSIRNLPQYKQRFPGLTRQDGTLRMTEAQYLQTEDGYKNLLRQNGFDVDRDFSSPSSLVGWFESEVAPDELNDRLQVYQQVKQGGQAIRDAFYVYAGLDISHDDLYEAIVDPAAEQRLSEKYNQAVASQTFDYATYITRATQVGLNRVADSLKQMQSSGALTGQVVQKLLNTDPNFARTVMDAIYTGGDPSTPTGTLSLNELLTSFQYAAIGAAAKNAGLDLPTKERLGEIRSAGIQQSQAASAYSEFGRNKDLWNAAVQRARGTAFGQEQFEKGQFLGDASASRMLEQGLTVEKMAGHGAGSFRFAEDDGRLVQRGFKAA